MQKLNVNDLLKTYKFTASLEDGSDITKDIIYHLKQYNKILKENKKLKSAYIELEDKLSKSISTVKNTVSKNIKTSAGTSIFKCEDL